MIDYSVFKPEIGKPLNDDNRLEFWCRYADKFNDFWKEVDDDFNTYFQTYSYSDKDTDAMEKLVHMLYDVDDFIKHHLNELDNERRIAS